MSVIFFKIFPVSSFLKMFPIKISRKIIKRRVYDHPMRARVKEGETIFFVYHKSMVKFSKFLYKTAKERQIHIHYHTKHPAATI